MVCPNSVTLAETRSGGFRNGETIRHLCPATDYKCECSSPNHVFMCPVNFIKDMGLKHNIVHEKELYTRCKRAERDYRLLPVSLMYKTSVGIIIGSFSARLNP